jgi:hypothetical protein
MRRNYRLLFALLASSLSAAGCVPVPALETSNSWTASPITVAPVEERGTTGRPSDRGTSTTPTRIRPTFTARPTETPTPRASATPTPSATPDPHRVLITEQDVLRSVQAGAAAQRGAQVEGLGVRFVDGRMRITADRLGYGVVSLRDLVLVGRLEARNGQLQMEVESVQPGGLVAAFVPGMVNQALAQYASQWYVEEVRTLDGRLELRIR